MHKQCKEYKQCKQCKQCLARCYLHLWWYFFVAATAINVKKSTFKCGKSTKRWCVIFDNTDENGDGNYNGDGHLDRHTITECQYTLIKLLPQQLRLKEVYPQMWEKYQKMAGSQPKQNKSLESLLGGRKLRGFVNAINSKVRNWVYRCDMSWVFNLDHFKCFWL